MDRIKDFIGDLWGKTTTLVTTIGLMVVAISADPAVQPIFDLWPGARRAVAILGAGLAILRIVAPPPPSIAIKQDDEVLVDRASGAVTVIKADEVPAGIVDKAPGEKV